MKTINELWDHYIGQRTEWLWDPESPGMKVLVRRGFWGRAFKPTDFATLGEAINYSEFLQGLRKNPSND